jgi:hypothetical protein
MNSENKIKIGATTVDTETFSLVYNYFFHFSLPAKINTVNKKEFTKKLVEEFEEALKKNMKSENFEEYYSNENG